MIADLLLLSVFPLAMVSAAATDLRVMRVPNWISALLVGGFAVLAPIAGLGFSEIGLHALVAFFALIVAFGLFSFGWIGGGDAKLFAATCLWMGPGQSFPYALTSAVLGGVLTLLVLWVRSAPLPAVCHERGWLARLHDGKTGIPYGPALAGAGLALYPNTALVMGLTV